MNTKLLDALVPPVKGDYAKLEPLLIDLCETMHMFPDDQELMTRLDALLADIDLYYRDNGAWRARSILDGREAFFNMMAGAIAQKTGYGLRGLKDGIRTFKDKLVRFNALPDKSIAFDRFEVPTEQGGSTHVHAASTANHPCA